MDVLHHIDNYGIHCNINLLHGYNVFELGRHLMWDIFIFGLLSIYHSLPLNLFGLVFV